MLYVTSHDWNDKNVKKKKSDRRLLACYVMHSSEVDVHDEETWYAVKTATNN